MKTLNGAEGATAPETLRPQDRAGRLERWKAAALAPLAEGARVSGLVGRTEISQAR